MHEKHVLMVIKGVKARVLERKKELKIEKEEA
jgi:hypothetical protein